jgi:integrase
LSSAKGLYARALIIAASKKLATLLQILKERGVRLGEALSLEWTDIDFERNVIRVNHPEKGSNPRILIMGKKLANMINTLPKQSQMVLSRKPQTCETALWSLRRKIAFKLQNPRLQSITFHTFRHWKATTEYHKTHDIFHVQRILGHKNIQNTAIYVTLENSIFQTESNDFHVAVAKTMEDACKLLEVASNISATWTMQSSLEKENERQR